MNDMLHSADERAESLDRYWEALVAGGAAEASEGVASVEGASVECTPAVGILAVGAPAGVDPDLARLAAGLAASAMAPHQDADSTARVRRRVAAQAELLARGRPAGPAARTRSRLWPFSGPHAGPFAGLAAAALVALVALGVYLVALRPQTASAADVLKRAQAASASPLASSVHSFQLTETWHAQGGAGGWNVAAETRIWWEAPGRYRIEQDRTVAGADGKPQTQDSMVEVSDGQTTWQYDPASQRVTINNASPRSYTATGVMGFGQDAGDVSKLLADAERCFTPKIAGSATVAGRAAYVVDMGPNRCPSASAPDSNGRQVLWVDKETAFVLKQETYSTQGDRLMIASEVTSVQYNGAIDAGRFTFAVPEGAAVADYRPSALPTAVPAATPTAAPTATPVPGAAAVPPATAEPAPEPTPDPLQTALVDALKSLAGQVDYPLFMPGRLPPGLAPRQPRLDPGQDGGSKTLRLEYVRPADVEQDVMAIQQGVEIVEQRATYDVVVQWTGGATRVAAPQGKAWVRLGITNVDGTGSDSAALALRDGTLISASSFGVSPEALYQIVLSLAPVPGSHAALPAPAAPSLDDVRAHAAYPVFVPTWVPDGLRPDAPVGTRIDYRDASGQVALNVLSGPAGSGLASDPRKGGQTVTLPNGSTAHLLGGGGGSDTILWWEQDGAYVAVEGHGLTQETLTRIAGSMSQTAGLGETSSPLDRATPVAGIPTPTPTATPSFRILRPAWLPEEMTERMQVDGEGVVLGFVPRSASGTTPGAVTLRETAARPGSQGAIQDPQATVEQIGPYAVTVVRRGADCTSFDWQAGDLHLDLNNLYDPPGQLKYSCAQLRQMVASVK